jgi:hypothetical protein
MNVFVRGHRCAMAVLSLALFAGLSSSHLSATTVAVGSCVSGVPRYTTIQEAVNAVSTVPGAIVKVCPNTYAEQVNISSKLTLEGVTGTTAAIIVPPASGLVQNGMDINGNPVAAQIFVAAGNGNTVTVERLTVDGTGNNLAGCGAPTFNGIYFQNTPGTISYNTVRNQYQTDYADYGGCQNGLAINVESSTDSPAITISNNSVHAYQKNGITASGDAPATANAPSVAIKDNYIVGLGSTAMNWQPGGGAAENGVQIGFGASGSVSSNIVNDNIWGPDTFSQPYNAASGILVFASNGITVSSNYIGSAQFGIAIDTDGSGFCSGANGAVSCGTANNTSVTSNKISGTQLFDAIDACSNNNNIVSNTIYNSAESAVHFDDSCTSSTYGTTSGNGNNATGNTINEACAGVLLGTGIENTGTPNTNYNVVNLTMSGDSCPASPNVTKQEQGSKKPAAIRPLPYKPGRK